MKRQQKACFFPMGIVQLDPSKILDAENFL